MGRKQADQGKYETEASDLPGILGILQQTKYAERWASRRNAHTAYLGAAIYDGFVKMAESRGLPTDRFCDMKIVRVDQDMLNNILRERGEFDEEKMADVNYFMEVESEPIEEVEERYNRIWTPGSPL